MVGRAVAGIGWGLAETVMNPLIASLYPAEKTAKLNAAHAWWPGGVVVGGLLGVGMSQVGLGWQAKLMVVVAPAIAVILRTSRRRHRSRSASPGPPAAAPSARPGLCCIAWIACMIPCSPEICVRGIASSTLKVPTR